MDIVAQVRVKVNEVFHEKNLHTLARETGFIVRKRKINPKAFLEKMIFLRLECPHSSLEDLVYEFYKSDMPLSKQALHKKFNPAGVDFVQKVLAQLLDHAMREQKISLGKLPGVHTVQVVDSSEIRLNNALKARCPQVRNQGAAIKLQTLMDVVSHQVLSLETRPSQEPDQGYKAYLHHVQAGDLFITDLGYFCIDSFKEIHRKKGFFLSRYFKQTQVYDLNTDAPLDLRMTLSQVQGDTLDLPIALGASKFPCRLVAVKLTPEAYQKRVKNLKEKRRQDPRLKVNQGDRLNSWTIFVTNLPLSVEAEVFLRLYSLRWQIELLFKMMKTFLYLRKVDAVHPHRSAISVYVSLIAMTLLSLVATTVVEQEISLYKASKAFIKNIREFFHFINSKRCAVSWFKGILCKFALKESRPKRPSTKLTLEPRYA